MLTIDYRSGESLYIQIKNNFKKMILSEALKENEMLPSVRTLASSLAININTVQRAYRELEQEGYIYSVPGKGNFVAKLNKSVINKNLDDFKTELFLLLEKARLLDISKDEIGKLVGEFYENRGEDK
jgi:GntR family transcriptional regulator